MNRKKIIYRVLLIAMMVIIFILSHQEGTQSSNLSNTFAHKLNIQSNQWTEPSELKLFLGLNIQKYAHIFVYFLMGVFSFGAVCERKNIWLRPFIALIICYAYAVFDEFHQYFIPGRAAEFTDTLIDAIGLVTAIVICRLCSIWKQYQKSSVLT